MLDALALLAGGDRAAVARAAPDRGRRRGRRGAGARGARASRSRRRRSPTSGRCAPCWRRPPRRVGEALARLGGRAGVEEKLDGARVQVHRRGDTCRLYSRRLQELTPSLPDVVTRVLERLAVPAAILEGEVLPVDDAGRPLPFQELMRRFRRVKDVSRLVREVPVELEALRRAPGRRRRRSSTGRTRSAGPRSSEARGGRRDRRSHRPRRAPRTRSASSRACSPPGTRASW